MITKEEDRLIKQTWFLVALGLGILSLIFFYLGATLNVKQGNEYVIAILNSLGGATLAIALIDVFHEFFVARNVRSQFKILSDFKINGVERVCSSYEINQVGYEQLQKTKTFKGIGFGFQWLLDDNHDVNGPNQAELGRILKSSNSKSVLILLPDPCSDQIKERYGKDEPNTESYRYELGLEGISEAIKKWYGIQEKYQGKIEVRVYSCYPMANVNIYDDYIFVSAVLYKRRAKDGFTIVYRRGSKGAEIYESHIDEIVKSSSEPLTALYLSKLNGEYGANKSVN